MKALLLFIGIFTFTIIFAGEGEDIFKKTCAACHTIGKGRLVGPDLKNVADKQSQEWLVSFIKSSTTKIKSGDAAALAIFEEYNRILMPDNNFTDAQIINVLNYISSGTGAEGQAATATVDILIETGADNVSQGAALFSGNERLTNGGAACTSCHKVRDERVFSSGTLAKDLSQTYELMGSAGIAGIVKNPPFPVMGAAYVNHPLTEDEVINLTAYLKSVSEQRIYQVPTDFSLSFVFLGLVVFMVIIMSSIIIYFNRKKLAVNHDLLSRASNVIN
ncbi:MAG: cytochrome c [Bacteroidales bacterium]|nr:cytochrome c [Bacteroidales bacterium]MCF6342492.1 cytochrome c [Bacteroidales bacterium]